MNYYELSRVIYETKEKLYDKEKEALRLTKENTILREALHNIVKAENGYIGNDYALAKIARRALGLEDHIKEI